MASVLATCSISSRTFSHRRALADNFLVAGHFVDRSPQLQVLLAQPPLGQGLRDHVAELLRIDRLGDVIRRAQLQGPHGRIDGGVSRDHDDDRRGRGAADLLEQAHAVHAGQADVEQHHIERARLHGRHRFRGIGRRLNVIAVLAEPMIERVADGELVVDDQDAGQGGDIDVFPCCQTVRRGQRAPSHQ